jgi:putative PIN family toxin of toxin-antitoxin system
VRVVLDTGVVLSALLFAGRLAWLPPAWRSKVVVPAVSRGTTEELIRALTYPKFGLDSSEIESVLAAYLPWAETVEVDEGAEGLTSLPACRDPKDQQFLELAVASHAEALVASDRALIVLAEKTPFPIWSPTELKRRLAR